MFLRFFLGPTGGKADAPLPSPLRGTYALIIKEPYIQLNIGVDAESCQVGLNEKAISECYFRLSIYLFICLFTTFRYLIYIFSVILKRFLLY